MRILGIESSSLVASVAVVTDDVVTAEYTVNCKKTHSQTLLPCWMRSSASWIWIWKP